MWIEDEQRGAPTWGLHALVVNRHGLGLCLGDQARVWTVDSTESGKRR